MFRPQQLGREDNGLDGGVGVVAQAQERSRQLLGGRCLGLHT